MRISRMASGPEETRNCLLKPFSFLLFLFLFFFSLSSLFFPTFSSRFPFPMTGVCPRTSFPFPPLFVLERYACIRNPFQEKIFILRKAKQVIARLKKSPRCLDAFGRNKTWFTRGLCNFSSPRHYHRWIAFTNTRSAAGANTKTS